MNTRTQPDYLVSPGDILAEHLDVRGFSQKQFAQRCGYSEKHLSQLMTGKVSLTAEAAMKFEVVLGVPAKYWLDLEAQFKLDKLRLEGAVVSKEDVEWAKAFPIKEMVQFGWLPQSKGWDEKVVALLRFFSVTSPEGWELQFASVKEAQCRRSAKKVPDLHALSAWVQKLENEARTAQLPRYSPATLAGSILKIKKILENPKEDFWRQLEKTLGECGVFLSFAPHFPHTYLSGVTTWIADRPAIQLSLRYPFLDVVTFSLFHELAHVTLHKGKASRFVDFEDYGEDPLELQANNWASEKLIPSEEWQAFKTKPSTMTGTRITVFAKKVGVHPGTVVGRLAHEELLSWRSPLFTQYRVRIQSS
ncbi:MAG TPA: helix-turn-helix domain-containing protein [Fibrobacteria bacterium]|nr:helix-turn-helix domain-containing protein [Fibrobacteria bacterium]